MENKHKYVAFFDLDGTLLNVNSGEVLVHLAYKNGRMKKRHLLHAFYLAFLYKFKLQKISKIIEKMPKWLTGLSEQDIKDFNTNMFNEILVHAIRPKMYAELKRHQQQNGKLVILSAAFNYVCTPVANHLKMDDIICSHLEVVDGHFTGKTLGPLCFDDVKLSRVAEYCSQYNYKIEKAYYYGDSIADASVLAAVGFPKCVNPDKKLVKVALQNGWPVYNW